MNTATARKPRRVARKLYESSPRELMEIARRRYRPLARRLHHPSPITEQFLRSDEYQALMRLHVPCTGDYGLHEAETVTQSFLHRAFETDDRLGPFRWRGIQENLDLVLDLITDPSKLTVDLGGAASPFGLGSVVVDQLPFDCYGNEVPHGSLDELPRKADVIISSHTLEHIPELDAELERIASSMTPGGTFIALVPAYTCERWRAGTHSHATFGDHVWTFGLSGTTGVPDGLISYVEFDELLAKYFDVESVRYCGDDSIFAVCHPR